jgi:hypothetical protein
MLCPVQFPTTVRAAVKRACKESCVKLVSIEAVSHSHKLDYQAASGNQACHKATIGPDA